MKDLMEPIETQATTNQTKGRNQMQTTGKLMAILAGALAGLLAASSASATLISAIGGGSGGSARSDLSNYTVGTEILVGSRGFTVHALGVQDTGFITSPVHVGLWSASGTLLTDAFVASTDPISGLYNYRFATLDTPFTLQPNTEYVVGALVGNTTVNFLDGGGYASLVPDLSLVGTMVTPSPFLFSTPGAYTTRFGPANILGEVVPEPSTIMLFGFGGFVLWFRQRRIR